MTDKNDNSTRVCVDQARCGGHARCIEEAPEVFGYDDTTNKAFVLQNADLEASREDIDRAILACPERAIAWSN